jgi:hypothetical protein
MRSSKMLSGKLGCLSGNEKTAAGLLKDMTKAVVE